MDHKPRNWDESDDDNYDSDHKGKNGESERDDSEYDSSGTLTPVTALGLGEPESRAPQGIAAREMPKTITG